MKILKFESIYEFYAIQPGAVQKISDLKKKLNDVYKSKSNILHAYVPTVGMICVAHINNEWYRVEISKVLRSGFYNVELIDYGGKEEVKWENLFYLRDEFFATPKHVLRLSLFELNTIDSSNLNKMNQEFKNLHRDTNKYNAINEGNVGSNYEVTLRLLKSDDEKMNINNHLKEILYGKQKVFSTEEKTAPKSIGKYVDPTDINMSSQKPQMVKENQIPEKIKIVITHHVSPGEFYINVIKSNAEPDIADKDMQEKIEQFFTSDQNIHKSNWKERDRCFVKQKTQGKQNHWYRGAVVKVNGDECLVFLRDIGKTVEVNSPEGLIEDKMTADYPSKAKRCHLAFVAPSGMNTWSLTAKDKFIEYCKRFDELQMSVPVLNSYSSSTPVVLWSIEKKQYSALEPCKTVIRNINIDLIFHGVARSTVSDFDQIQYHECKDFQQNENSYSLIGDVLTDHTRLNSNKNSLDELFGPIQWKKAEPFFATQFEAVPSNIDQNMIIYALTRQQKQMIKKMSDELSKWHRDQDIIPLIDDWEEQEPCIAIYKERQNGNGSTDEFFNTYHRAQIIMVNSSQKMCKVMYINAINYIGIQIFSFIFFVFIQVRYIDWGNEDTIPFKHLSRCTMFHDIPIQVGKFCLNNIRPFNVNIGWPIEAIEYSRDAIGGYKCSFYIHDHKNGNVDAAIPATIARCSGSSDLASLLISHKFAVKITLYSQIEIDRSAKEEKERRTKNNNSNVVYVDSTNVQDNEDYKRLCKQNLLKYEPLISKHNQQDDENIAHKMFSPALSKRDLRSSSSSSSAYNPKETEIGKLIDLVNKHYEFSPLEKRFECKIFQIIDPITLLIIPEPSHQPQIPKSAISQNNNNDKGLLQNSPCIAFSKELKEWKRGIISGIRSRRDYEVLFIDTLERVTMNRSSVQECPEEYLKMPVSYAKVRLHKISPRIRNRDADICRELQQVLGSQHFEVNVRKENATPPTVRLYVLRTDEQKSKVLAYSELIERNFYKLLN